MIKQFIKDTGVYGIAGLISKGVSFFLLPLYTRVLTPADYGIIDILAVFYSIVAVTLPLEITQAVARFLADRKSTDLDKDSNTILVSTVGLFITLFSFGLFLILGLLFNKPLAQLILEDSSESNIFTIATIYMFSTGLFYFFQNQLRWTLKSKIYAFLSVVYTILSISGTILFVLILKSGVIGVFYAYLVAGIISAGMGWYFTRENYGFYFSFAKMREMLKFSLPLVPSSVGVILINVAQRVMIRGTMSLADLGLFGVGSRISSIITIGFQSVQGAITPLIYQNSNNKNTPENLSYIFRFLTFILIITFTGISLFSHEIILILTAPAFHASYILVPFLVLAECFTGIQNAFTPGMAIAKRTDIIAYINISGAVFALVLSYFLIRNFGILGAAIAMLIQRFSMFIVQMYYSQKFYFVYYPFKKVIQSLVIAIVIIFTGWQISLLFDSMIFSIALKSGMIVFLFVIMILFIKLIEVRELKEIRIKLLQMRDRLKSIRINNGM